MPLALATSCVLLNFNILSSTTIREFLNKTAFKAQTTCLQSNICEKIENKLLTLQLQYKNDIKNKVNKITYMEMCSQQQFFFW